MSKNSGPKSTKKLIPSAVFSDSRDLYRDSLGPLKRLDPEIVEILESATHATLYVFGESSAGWERGELEGPLFLVKTRSGFKLVVLNRLSTSNLSEVVNEDFETEVIDRYLIFRQKLQDKKQIRGLWFHSLEEHKKIATAIDTLVDRLQERTPPALSPPPGVDALLRPGLLKQKQPTPEEASREQSPLPLRKQPHVPQPHLPPPPGVAAPKDLPLDTNVLKTVLFDLLEDDKFLADFKRRYNDVLKRQQALHPQQQAPPQQFYDELPYQDNNFEHYYNQGPEPLYQQYPVAHQDYDQPQQPPYRGNNRKPKLSVKR